MKWKQICFYMLPSLFILSVVVIKVWGWLGSAERDYVAANKAFLCWDPCVENEGKGLLNLQKFMKKYPELHACYDAHIGQSFLALRNAQKAAFYVEKTLQRTKQPYYSDYARASLEIGRGEYLTALQRARQLKEDLLKNGSLFLDSSLFAFNLMRIATLCQEIGNSAEELEAWKEIKLYGGWEEEILTEKNAGFSQLLSHFTLQERTLLDYIRTREEEINKVL